MLSVVVVHSAAAGGAIDSSLQGRLLAQLGVGVAVFFVISGFLLYRPFIAWRTGGPDPPRLPDYAKRRLLRIYPAYWLVLTILVILPGLAGVVDGEWPQQYGLLQWLPLSDGTGCTGAPDECGLAQTWSLVVEVTFYAALPLYVLLAARLARGRPAAAWMRSELLLLGGLAVASLLLGYVQLEGEPRTWLGGTFAGYMVWFALGMGLAVISVGLEARERAPAAVLLIEARPMIPWLAALAIYVTVCLAIPPTILISDLQERVVHVCYGLIGALLIAPAVLGSRGGGLPRRLLAHPVVAWLGLVSYGIFLWHYAAVLELGGTDGGAGFGLVLAGTLAISISCAAASYYLVERPLLRFKYRPFRR